MIAHLILRPPALNLRPMPAKQSQSRPKADGGLGCETTETLNSGSTGCKRPAAVSAAARLGSAAAAAASASYQHTAHMRPAAEDG